MIDTTSGQPDDRAVAFQGKLDVGLDARRFQTAAVRRGEGSGLTPMG